MKGYRYTKEEGQRIIEEMCDCVISMHKIGKIIMVQELCKQFMISTTTFYKWLHMYVEVSSPEKYDEVRSILYQNNIERNQYKMTGKEKFLFEVYKLCTKEESNQEEIEQFCDRYQLTIKELGQCYELYLKNYATEIEYKRAKQAHYLRQSEKIIFSILKEERIEEKKAMLMKHKELYGLKAHVFVDKHPDYAMQIKQLTMLYQQTLDENRMLHILYMRKRKGK